MTSTGNDIVSLNAVNIARTTQPRFFSKILSDTEKALFNTPQLSAIPFENFVWLLWSLKESAYKYLQRTTSDLVFLPTKIIVSQVEVPFGYAAKNFELPEEEGTSFENMNVFKAVITFDNDILYSRSLLYKELIFSVVNGDDNFENTCWGIKVIDNSNHDHQSIAVREFLVNKLNNLLKVDNITFSKSSTGFPIVLKGTEPIAIPVSLAHHDCFVAYSFQLEDTL